MWSKNAAITERSKGNATRARRDDLPRPQGALLVFVVALCGVSPAEAQDLLGTPQIGVTIPTLATSAGFVYRYDPASGTFERESSLSGQILLERPESIGEGRWHLSAAYLFFEENSFDGFDFPSRFRLHVLSLGVTRGITERLELNLTTPILFVDQDDAPDEVFFDPILLRAKYEAYASERFRGAVGLVVRMLTESLASDVESRVQAAPMAYLAGEPIAVRPWCLLRPYFNGGVLFDEDIRDMQLRWGLGLDVMLAQRLTVSAAVVAKHQLRDEIIGGDTFDRVDVYDGALGVRADLWNGRVTAFAHVVLPLNNDGLRADFIPIVGADTTF